MKASSEGEKWSNMLNVYKVMTSVMRTTVLLILLSFALPVFAQEQADKPEGTTSEKTENKAKESKPKPKQKVFRPSEEISEDLPVPFPVDI